MRSIVWAAALALAMSAATAQAAPPVLPEIMLQTGHDCHVSSALWTHDSRFVLTASEGCDAQVILWEASTGRVFDRLDLPEARGARLAITPDSRVLIVHLEGSLRLVDMDTHATRNIPPSNPSWLGGGHVALMNPGKPCAGPGCAPLTIVDLATGASRPLTPGVQAAPGARLEAELAGAPGGLVAHVRRAKDRKELQALPLPAWADGVALTTLNEAEGNASLYYFNSRSGQWGVEEVVPIPTPGVDAFKAIPTPSNMGYLWREPEVVDPSGTLFGASFMRELGDGPKKGVFGLHPIAEPAKTVLLTGMPRVAAEGMVFSPAGDRLAMVTVEHFEAPGERDATDLADQGEDPREHRAPKDLKDRNGNDCAVYFDCDMRTLEVLNLASGKLQTARLRMDYGRIRWLSNTVLTVDVGGPGESEDLGDGGTVVFDAASGQAVSLPVARAIPIGRDGLWLGGTPTEPDEDGTGLLLYDAVAAKVVRTYEAKPAQGHGTLIDVALSADGRSVSAHYQSGMRPSWPLGPEAAAALRAPESQKISPPPLAANIIENGAVRLSTPQGETLFTLYLFRDGRYMLAAPDGRYDTNLPADTEMVGWVMRDQPRHLFAPQTFMRDYFEPGLLRRTLDCRKAGDCEAAFKPLRAVAELNRVLPTTRIVAVKPDPTGQTAVVEVEAAEGVDASAPNGKTRSGLHDLRLFRDGKLVGQFPEPPAARPGKARDGDWGRETALPAGVHRFTVALPTGAAGAFSAYAFNDDRVKGESATMPYAAQPKSARVPRAYVIAIGENRYDNPAWTLNFAAADARLTAGRLARLPGREAHAIALVSDGQHAQAAKAQVRDALRLLDKRTTPQARQGARARLAQAGVAAADLDGFDAATPDDTVILTFSGHGWAEPRGDFYLLPSDARADAATGRPRLGTMISAGELSDWLRTVDAGEMAIVIDACHSAASVEGEGFKAGPFGDAGLGQLAFDKGIRILAASQAADVALEDARLGHGLLTQVLANEGLDASGYGRADLDKDGRITLDEWLRFASTRLPQLSEEVRGGGSAGRGFGRIASVETERKAQEPALFDFTGKTSAVALRLQPARKPR